MKLTPRYIIVKFLKTKDKDKFFLKHQRKSTNCIHGNNYNSADYSLTEDFSLEAMEAKRHYNIILHFERGKENTST